VTAHNDAFLDLCAALAVGAIDPADRRDLEAHLAGGCTECHDLLQALSAPVEALARSVDPVAPGRGLKARTMVAVARTKRSPSGGVGASTGARPGARRLPATWMWAAAAVLLVVAGAGWWHALSLHERVDELTGRLQSAGPDADGEWAAFLAANPGARVVELAANANGDADRHARVAYDAASRRALVRVERFQPPAGQAFELWTIRGGKPVSEGLLRVDAAGRGLVRIENTGDPAELAAFAVSREAPGGSKDRQTPGTVAWVGAVPK
jgi:hypothetical protein